MPPRHGKSELISRWLPLWFLELFPERRVQLASYAADFAAEWGAKTRDSADAGVELGLRLRINPFARANASWRTTRGGGMQTAGVGGPLTGRGADLAVIDDPVKNMREALSPATRESIWSWYGSTFRTRLEPGGSIVVLMTRWHQDDLVGRLIGSQAEPGADQWTVINLGAEALPDDPMGRPEGAPLWPERYDAAALAPLKALRRIWWPLYQGQPLGVEEELFPLTDWVRYSQRAEVPDAAPRVLSVDAAFKGNPTSDRVAIVKAAVTPTAVYLEDADAAPRTFTQTWQRIRAMSAADRRIRAVLIEDKANGPAIVDTLRGKLPAGVLLLPIDPEGGKEARATAAAQYVESGQVLLPHDDLAPWVRGFAEELRDFPAGAYDDQVDAFSQLVIALLVRRVVALDVPQLPVDSLTRERVY